MIMYADDAFKIHTGNIFKQMQPSKSLEASRQKRTPRLTPIPRNLQSILEAVGLVPVDALLPDLSKQFSRLLSTSRMSEEKKHVAAHEVVEKCLKKLPAEFRRHVWCGGKQGPMNLVEAIFLNGSPADSRSRLLNEFLRGDDEVLDDIYYGTIESAVEEYSFVRESREKLRRLIELTTHRGSVYAFMFPLASSGSIRVDQSGIVRISNDRFAEAVKGVDASLIRACNVCDRMFWAGRRDKNACSTVCAHVLRNRRYRERYRQGLYQGAQLTAKEKASLHKSRVKRQKEKGR